MSYWPDPPGDGPDLDDDFTAWCADAGWDPEDDDAAQAYEEALDETAADHRADAILDARDEGWD